MGKTGGSITNFIPGRNKVQGLSATPYVGVGELQLDQTN